MSTTISYESHVFGLIQKKYAGREYVVIPQVRNAAGFSATRTADALVMSVWPSRGLYLMGYEIKCSRTDWLKELKSPAKAEIFAQFCKYWYVVFSHPSVGTASEVPEGWGLLVCENDKLLEKKKPAPRDDVKQPTFSFVAALLNRAAEHVFPDPSEDAIKKRIDAAVESQRKCDVEAFEKTKAAYAKAQERLNFLCNKFRFSSPYYYSADWEKEAAERADELLGLERMFGDSVLVLSRVLGEVKHALGELGRNEKVIEGAIEKIQKASSEDEPG